MERFRYKKTKARQAQAKLTQIGRLEQERAKAVDELELLNRRQRTLGFDFFKPARSGRTVLEVSGLEVAAGDKHLLADASFALERGEHVALVGPNGSGKTTLLETLLGRREPDRRQDQAGPQRRAGLLLAARGRARRAADRARVRAARDRARAPAGAEPARPLSLLGLGGAPEVGLRPLGRRAAPAGAGPRGRLRGESPRPRRADEPPGSREPRGARGSARGLSRDGAPGLARPRAARRSRRADARDRGRHRAQLPRRLGRLRGPPGRGSSGRARCWPGAGHRQESVTEAAREAAAPQTGRAGAARGGDRGPGGEHRRAGGSSCRRLGRRRRRRRPQARPRAARSAPGPLGAPLRGERSPRPRKRRRPSGRAGRRGSRPSGRPRPG